MKTSSNFGRAYKARFPELYQFFAGYFYQGWASDYRWDASEPSFEAVVRHFRAVNPPPVVDAVRNQLDEFVTGVTDDEDIRIALFELGCGYDPGYEGLSGSGWLGQIAELLSESAAISTVLRERN